MNTAIGEARLALAAAHLAAGVGRGRGDLARHLDLVPRLDLVSSLDLVSRLDLMPRLVSRLDLVYRLGPDRRPTQWIRRQKKKKDSLARALRPADPLPPLELARPP